MGDEQLANSLSHRSAHRPAAAGRMPGHRPVQPVLHARRPLGDRGRGGPPAPRLPRSAHAGASSSSVPLPCRGVDHMDFSADGGYLLASCEFSGDLVVRRPRRGLAVAPSAPSRRRPDAAGREAEPGRERLLRRRHDRGGVCVIDARPAGACWASSAPAPARTACIRAATPATSTSRTAARARSRCSLRDRRIVAKWRIPRRQPRHGRRLAPTAGRCGCRAATTPRCTRSTRAPAVCCADRGRPRPARPRRMAAAGPLLARPTGILR